MSPARSPFEAPPLALWRRAVVPGSVMLASLASVWPFIATFPIVPPLALMTLLAWRLRRPEALPIWAPLPLGLFDDLLSGQPLGCAMLLWMLSFFAIDLVERRVLMFRDFWQDWLVAGGAIVGTLAMGRLVAVPLGAHVDTVLLVQALIAVLLYPVVASVVGALDGWRHDR